MRTPDIHGNHRLHLRRGSLVRLRHGGTATRLTTSSRAGIRPKFSPDGTRSPSRQATTGNGGLPHARPGGIPRRLTYMPGNRHHLLDPRRQARRLPIQFERSSTAIPTSTSWTQRRLPRTIPLDRGIRCSFSPDGKIILYSRKGMRNTTGNATKGDSTRISGRYRFADEAFTPISDYVGKNSYPMWIGDKMYFVSDRTTASPISASGSGHRKITPRHHLRRLRRDDALHRREAIVYRLQRLSPSCSTSHRKIPHSRSPSPATAGSLRNRTIDAKEYIHSVDPTNDGKRAVLEARGDLFTVPTGKGTPVNLPDTPAPARCTRALARRQRSPSSPTGAASTSSICSSPDGGEWTPLTTSLDRTAYQLVWSPDGKKILFGNKDYAIFVVDVATKKLTKIDESNQMKNDEFTGRSATTHGRPTAVGHL